MRGPAAIRRSSLPVAKTGERSGGQASRTLRCCSTAVPAQWDETCAPVCPAGPDVGPGNRRPIDRDLTEVSAGPQAELAALLETVGSASGHAGRSRSRPGPRLAKGDQRTRMSAAQRGGQSSMSVPRHDRVGGQPSQSGPYTPLTGYTMASARHRVASKASRTRCARMAVRPVTRRRWNGGS